MPATSPAQQRDDNHIAHDERRNAVKYPYSYEPIIASATRRPSTAALMMPPA